MRVCGFEHYGDGFNDNAYRVPSESAFSRFIAMWLEVERDTAGMSQMAYHGVDKARRTLKYHGPATHYGFECLGRKVLPRRRYTAVPLPSGAREVR